MHTRQPSSPLKRMRASYIYIYLHAKRCDRYVDEQKWKMSGLYYRINNFHDARKINDATFLALSTQFSPGNSYVIVLASVSVK